MKSIALVSIIAASLIFSACGNDASKTETTATDKKNDTSSTPVATQTTTTDNGKSVDDLVTSYLSIKNALAKDDGKAAATAGKELAALSTTVNTDGFTAEQKKMYDEVKDAVKENAEHIGDNADKIAHQREHFEELSKDMIDLVKAKGTSRVMYKDFCPMYNDNKGAAWLSEQKEISNPYLGKKMPTCGELKEEINKQ